LLPPAAGGAVAVVVEDSITFPWGLGWIWEWDWYGCAGAAEREEEENERLAWEDLGKTVEYLFIFAHKIMPNCE
jgi:hypothetical protein